MIHIFALVIGLLILSMIVGIIYMTEYKSEILITIIAGILISAFAYIIGMEVIKQFI